MNDAMNDDLGDEIFEEEIPVSTSFLWSSNVGFPEKSIVILWIEISVEKKDV